MDAEHPLLQLAKQTPPSNALVEAGQKKSRNLCGFTFAIEIVYRWRSFAMLRFRFSTMALPMAWARSENRAFPSDLNSSPEARLRLPDSRRVIDCL